MTHRLLALLLLGMAGAAAPALGASDSEARLCHDIKLEPPFRVEACARALAASDLTKRQQLDLLTARAAALDQLGDYARAIADYDSAIVLAPDDAVLHLNRGVAKIHDGRPADAIEDYGKAIHLKPDWHLPYFDRAVALGDLGQRAAALKDYERAIQRKPDDAWIYVGQGDVLAASGDPLRAIAAYDKALALRPELDDPRAKRAELLLRLDRPAEALPELDRVVAGNPSKPGIWHARGEAKFQLARYAEAAEDLRRALDLAPRDKGVRRALARAELGAGDSEDAWRTMSLALGASENEATDLSLAAMVALLTNRMSAAEGLVRRAIDIKPGEGTAQAILALYLRRQGDADGAREAAALAATFAPGDAEIAAVAKLAGAELDPAATPAPATPASPAQQALADCVADLRAGDLAAAGAAAAGWSLCHLAAVLAQ
ncbi:MAG TPA: tetratricopeptide repeat protein [Dongiaceae bacterium]|jgi:tetratricopeptide (TPR) repeat protein|nr:tetratricopeptide repeat protein [Dongiaceae bacterium]